MEAAMTVKFIQIIFLISFIIAAFISCSDSREYDNAKRIAALQYAVGCNGGSSEICKSGCDPKCGIGTLPLTTAKMDCAKICSDDCTRSCSTIFLFILNSK